VKSNSLANICGPRPNARADHAEVTEGQIAVAKSLIARDFGQRMVTDHTAANNQLSAIAAQEHIPQSPVLTGPEQQDIVTLEILTDPDFTRAYLEMQVVDHIQTLRQFLQETKIGQDPALVTFAQEQVPTLMQHLDSAAALDLAVRGLPPNPVTVNNFISSLAPDLPRGSAAVGGVPDPAHAVAVPSFNS
jgi:predicted outer membrane protein